MRIPLALLLLTTACVYPGTSVDEPVDLGQNDPFVVECLGGMMEAESVGMPAGAAGASTLDEALDQWMAGHSRFGGLESEFLEEEGAARVALVDGGGRTVAVVSFFNGGNGWSYSGYEGCASR